jgi:transketolase
MMNPEAKLVGNLLTKDVKQEPIRAGFGRGLLAAGERNPSIVALCADLTDSTKMNAFAEAFPERFVEVGVAEQNLVTVASGMSLMGKIPFVSSYAAFSPGRNWEQIRTTICLNQANVKIVGSHAGVSVGPDGATHQMLEDITLMRVLPHMIVVVPCDAVEAEKSPVITSEATPFALNKAQVFREGEDITIVTCGIMVYQALVAAESLAKKGIEAEVVNCPVVKPLDTVTLLHSIKKTGRVVTCEEGQITGGLGGAIAELTAEQHPVPLKRIGMIDHFGESGTPDELLEHFGLTAPHIAKAAQQLIQQREK